jgi:GNAT superfamily N-acetyltransferase
MEDAVVAVLTEAFAEDRSLGYVVGDEPTAREPKIRSLVAFFVRARLLRDEPVLGVFDDAELVGAALVSYPWVESPEALADLRQGLWHELGADAQTRYEAIGRAAASVEVGRTHIHLNLIGVRRTHRGAGIGRRLVDAAQGVSRDLAPSEGVSLVAEGEKNLRFYRNLGFRVLGHEEIAPGLGVNVLFRSDEAA